MMEEYYFYFYYKDVRIQMLHKMARVRRRMRSEGGKGVLSNMAPSMTQDKGASCFVRLTHGLIAVDPCCAHGRPKSGAAAAAACGAFHESVFNHWGEHTGHL